MCLLIVINNNRNRLFFGLSFLFVTLDGLKLISFKLSRIGSVTTTRAWSMQIQCRLQLYRQYFRRWIRDQTRKEVSHKRRLFRILFFELYRSKKIFGTFAFCCKARCSDVTWRSPIWNFKTYLNALPIRNQRLFRESGVFVVLFVDK